MNTGVACPQPTPFDLVRAWLGMMLGLAMIPAWGAAPPRAGADSWQLVWQDDFNRANLGTNWLARHGQATLTNGQLFLMGPGAVLLVNRPFASDVKLEFQARANPELPPCDLSAALASNPFFGYHYLLAFGGNHNQINQILGGDARRVDRQPAQLIEPGRTYRLTAVKEGPTLSYWVDDRLLLQSTDPDPVGGPGFDRVGLVTWNGMWVDDVRVYERTPPAPGGPIILTGLPDAGLLWKERRLEWAGHSEPDPELMEGIRLYNERHLEEALATLQQCSPPTLASVVALAWVLGDLNYQERPGDQTTLATLAATVAAAHPADPPAADFLQAARWFERVTLTSRNRTAVMRLVHIDPAHNPFYHKARLYQARYHYASAVEGADRRRIQEALDLFAELKTLWPEHPTLREFTGDSIPWGQALIRPASDGPAWARYLQEMLARQHAILHWWFTERQAADGQLGGGWGDDVELLRNWGPVASITSAGETARAGIDRLAEGLWNHALQDGFSPDIGDVEHSAEPSADVLPILLLLRYGDPRPVAWNLQSARTIRERFLDLNQRGHLQFVSAEFGADGVNRHPAAGGDTGYHARAMRHFIWLAWYGLPEALQVFLQWCDTWREAILIPTGTKPSGFAPASLFFPSGDIFPPDGRAWHDPAAHYYGFPGLPTKIHDALLTATWLSGDPQFLVPVRSMLDWSAAGPLRQTRSDLPGDHPDNLLAHLSHQASPDILVVYRELAQDPVYDDFLLARAHPAQRFRIRPDWGQWEAHLEKVCRSMRFNWARRTSEVLQTDRAGLQGAWEVFCAYTGAWRDFTDAGAPTMAVTWDTPNLNFAALVTHASRHRLRLALHNFDPQPQSYGLRPWLLPPGQYQLQTGQPLPADPGAPTRYAWDPPHTVLLTHRGAPLRVDIPSRTPCIIDLSLQDPRPPAGPLPDLAVHARDVRMRGSLVEVTIHNLGASTAGPFTASWEWQQDGHWITDTQMILPGLPRSTGFQPARTNLTLSLRRPASATTARLRLDPADDLPEITEENNQTCLSISP